MKQYKQLLQRILNEGYQVPDRTGTGTIAVFGHQMRFNLELGFPLVTTKKTFWRGAFVELLWMLRGDTNIQYLHEHNVHIWDEWADSNGDLGPVYGAQWRNRNGVDQIAEVLWSLKNDPHSRRHIVDSWNTLDLPVPGMLPSGNASMQRMALAPCHCLFQFHVDADYNLSCQVYQRSADVFLGVPFNIAGYALLTHLVAYHLGMGVGELVWTGGDCHLYRNHYQQALEVMDREPYSLPDLRLTHDSDTPLDELSIDTIAVTNYQHHPAIKGEVAV